MLKNYSDKEYMVRAASDKSFWTSTHLLSLLGVDDKELSVPFITLFKPSTLIIPNWAAFAAAPTYVLKNMRGLPLMSFGGGIGGYGSSDTTCKKTAFTICGYS